MNRKPSILVVDDSRDGREMLTQYLSFRGFHVVEATNGTEAIQVASRVHPQVILMDLSMDGVDGWEATRRLKADPLTSDIIVIAVTAHVFPREQDAARAAGCDAVVAKPYDLADLAQALGRVTSKGIASFRRNGTLTRVGRR